MEDLAINLGVVAGRLSKSVIETQCEKPSHVTETALHIIKHKRYTNIDRHDGCGSPRDVKGNETWSRKKRLWLAVTEIRYFSPDSLTVSVL